MALYGPAGEPAAAAARPVTLGRAILADGEIIVLDLKPSLWFVPMVSAPVVAAGIILMLAQPLTILAHILPVKNLLQWQDNAGLWIIVLRLCWAMLQWWSRSYILTDRRIIRQEGVLNVTVFECGLDRLQNSYISQTVVQRILGIGTILFATASGPIEALWVHVSRPGAVHKTITETAERFQRRNGQGGV
jgi:uncharacterized membrane protein YdbT with pleckstrin-like domain